MKSFVQGRKRSNSTYDNHNNNIVFEMMMPRKQIIYIFKSRYEVLLILFHLLAEKIILAFVAVC